MNQISAKKPNLFIVGHPRSGTSSLHDYLNQHPDIFMTAIKEPNFFALDFREASDRFHGKQLYFPYRSEERYMRLYRKWKHESIGGEASATNLCSKVSAREIHRFNPQAKIIMLFREPVDFLYSYHSATQFALGEHHKNFEKALEAEKSRRRGQDLSKRVISPPWLFYSEFVKYADQLRHFQNYFDKDHIKIIIFDDFKAGTPDVFRNVLSFLDVAPDFRPSYGIVNPNKQIRWPLLKKYTLDSPYFRKTLRLFFSDESYAGMKSFYKTKMVKHKPRPTLDEALRTKLMKKIKPEIEDFSKTLDLDLLARWGYHKI
jgi:Sulfotransferase family